MKAEEANHDDNPSHEDDTRKADEAREPTGPIIVKNGMVTFLWAYC